MRVEVKDVMTTQVSSVNGSTPFKDVAEVLIAHGVSALPVVDGEGHVIGVVSEADLLRKEEFRERYYREGYRPPLRARLRHRLSQEGTDGGKAHGDTAAQLMTAPAVTIGPRASIVTAVRLMEEHGVKRLPVVDDAGLLEGIVSRRDLLKVFVRRDADIADEVREEILRRTLWPQPNDATATVAQGIVTLTGRMHRRSDAQFAARMAGRVNGVVDVIDNLQWDQDDTPVWTGR
ncbi:CBS domain-containing protein [Streptosporangium roseum]|uniref:CBS domain containing membrane protein n=1 Tax=Streptosporangium roseum (strain ATCC 12428 / DSM 43021 / JCM 3005 / KCTC 9067 / NCIMB 10171 / NRRL 2505 / NI 9100) TaxID=479432 RepID=D2B6S0_STRRD|nr:CBS domain-containing protein [Streptosporangium roseum]ACZ87658.1 CBS domain containing membrane protein [Streptosporangium roseum DSM 43021]